MPTHVCAAAAASLLRVCQTVLGQVLAAGLGGLYWVHLARGGVSAQLAAEQQDVRLRAVTLTHTHTQTDRDNNRLENSRHMKDC